MYLRGLKGTTLVNQISCNYLAGNITIENVINIILCQGYIMLTFLISSATFYPSSKQIIIIKTFEIWKVFQNRCD